MNTDSSFNTLSYPATLSSWLEVKYGPSSGDLVFPLPKFSSPEYGDSLQPFLQLLDQLLVGPDSDSPT